MGFVSLRGTRTGFTAAVTAPHGLHVLIHRPSQADPRDERGPAQQDEGDQADDAAEGDVSLTGGFEFRQFAIALWIFGHVRPPAARCAAADGQQVRCGTDPAHPSR
jgi:hypothetical protein